MNFRKLPSDEHGRRLSYRKWQFIRWWLVALCAICALNGLGVLLILFSLRGTPLLDQTALEFSARHILGASVIGLAGFAAFRWFGKRKPPETNEG